MSHEEHKRHAPVSLRFAVLTVSDSRDEGSDETGRALLQLLKDAGHTVGAYAVVKDDAQAVAGTVRSWLSDPAVQSIVINGGTGVSPRDVTVEAVRPLLEKELPGFGELFRALSFEEIGSAAYLSRALAGTARGAAIFCLPGSPNAARLGLVRLILPEAGHLWGMMHPGKE